MRRHGELAIQVPICSEYIPTRQCCTRASDTLRGIVGQAMVKGLLAMNLLVIYSVPSSHILVPSSHVPSSHVSSSHVSSSHVPSSQVLSQSIYCPKPEIPARPCHVQYCTVLYCNNKNAPKSCSNHPGPTTTNAHNPGARSTVINTLLPL
jgi:hypothetical protein